MTQSASPDFQNYLQSVCAEYKRWWNLYTLTDALGQKPAENEELTSPFDFGQIVKTLPTKQSEEEQEKEEQEQEKEEQGQEKTERMSVLEGIRKYAPHHVLLIGKPGSGKSTALERLLLEEAEQASSHLSSSPNQDQVKIPVLLKLRYYHTSVLDLIRHWFQGHRLFLSCSEIKTLLFQRRFLLLIDGLNEVPSTEAIRDLEGFRQANPTTPMIFTTRELDLGGNLGIEKLLEMQPLTEAQSQNFVRSYLSEQGEQLLKQMGKRLRQFGQTPLLLWMLCVLFRQIGEIPSNLGLIFRHFTQRYERRIQRCVSVEEDRRQWQYLLQYLAFEMIRGKEPTDFRLAIPKQEAQAIFSQFFQGKKTDPDSLAISYLDDLLKYHLIQIGSSEQVEFRHQLLQEYYAAEYLLQKLDDLSNEELKSNYLNYLKWTEPLALMLALLEKEEQAQQVIRLALEVDLNLAARLAGEVKLEFQEKTVDLIEQLKVPTLLKIQFLEKTSSETAVPILIQALKDNEEYELRERAIEALGKIGSEAAVSGLIQVLRDEDYDIRLSAAESLGKIGSETAVPILIQALNNNEGYEVGERVIEALGKIDSETAVSGLIQVLRDEDSGLRWNAAEALGEIGSETAVPTLIQDLKHEDYKVREGAAVALGIIGSETAVPSLIQALTDEDYYKDYHLHLYSHHYIRERAAEALGEIGSEIAVPGLIEALNHEHSEDSVAQEYAAEALGEIGSEIAVPSLIQALKHKDFQVRKKATKALRKIGSEIAVPGLIEALKDENSDVRERVAEALGKLDLEIAVPDLIQSLSDRYPNVRWTAAEALGKIRSQTAVPHLIPALKDENYWVRKIAAEALGKIRSQTAVPHLIPALKDENSDVRWVTANVLGEIGSENAVPHLIPALKDENYWVRWATANVLGEIGSENAVPHLIPALKDEDSVVRKIATEALGKIGSETAVPYLIEALNHEDFKVSRRAVSALGKIGSETAVPHLIEALNHEDSGFRKRAVSALGKIGSETAVPHLIEALSDKEYEVRESAVQALEKIGSETAVLGLIRVLKHGHLSIRESAVEALEKIGSETAVSGLIQALKHGHYGSSIRKRAVEALGKIGSETAVPSLIKDFTNEDFDVRNRAASALVQIGSPRSLSQLWRLQLKVYETYINDAILKIQARCQFYNYEIAQSPFIKQQKPSQLPSDRMYIEYGNVLMLDKPEIKIDQSRATIGVGFAAEKSKQEFTQNIQISQQELAKAASEIQELLEQLGQNNPTIVESQEQEIVVEAIEQEINKNPTIKARLLSALKAGGAEALNQALEAVFNNPLVSIPVETIKGFIEP